MGRLLLLLLIFASCHSGERSAPADAVRDSAVPLVQTIREEFSDTVYDFRMNGKYYRLMLTHRQNLVTYEPFTIVRVLEGNDTIFRQDCPHYNVSGKFFSSNQKDWFLELVSDGGGSGFSGTIFQLHLGDEPVLDTVLNFNELTSWKWSTSGDNLLVAQGDWVMGNPDDSTFESHYSPHAQTVFIVHPAYVKSSAEILGTTKGKYGLPEDENEWHSIREKETSISAKIDWASFGL